MEAKRVYIGGLYHEATEKDIRQLFSKFGDVENVEIKKRSENNVVNFVFAYVNVKSTDPQISQCFKRLNGTFWKGKRLKLELAKESFLAKLQREREQSARTGGPDGRPAPAPAPPRAPPKRKTLQDRILDDVLLSKRRAVGPSAGSPGRVVDFTDQAEAAAARHGEATLHAAPPTTGDEPPPTRGALPMFAGIGGAAPAAPAAPVAPVAPVAAPVTPSSRPWRAARPAGAAPAPAPAPGGAASPGPPPAAGSDFLSRLEAFSAVWGDDGDGGARAPFVPGRRPPERPAPAPAPTAPGSPEDPAPAPAPAPAPRRSVAVTSAVDDNKKRMESLRQKQEAFQSQKRALQLALSARADAARPNKRIVFDDSDQDEGDDPRNSGHVTRSAGNGPSLFDDEEEEQEDTPDAEDFRIRPQYEGEKGQKLQTLRARHGADERFTMDERFADKDDELADEDEKEDEDGVREEHKQQMDILQSVLGTSVDTDRKGKKDTRSATGPVRFDPSLESHAQYQLDAKKPAASQRPAAPAAAPVPAGAEAAAAPEVGSGTFYQVAPKLGDLFARGSRAGGGFSLLKMMGRASEDGEDGGGEGEYKASEIKTKTKHPAMEGAAANPFQYDSSSSEDEAEGGATIAPLGVAAGGWSQTRKFFLQPDDPRLSEGLEWVRAAPSQEELQQRAEKQRPELLELFRTMKHSRQRVMRRSRGRGRRPPGR